MTLTSKQQESKSKMEHMNVKCDSKNCIGGRAFQIRDKVFCSPSCGNRHFNLTPNDDDYWPNEEDEE